MIAKISHFTFLSNILIISCFSVMQAADQTPAAIRQERIAKTIQPPILNPASNTHSQPPITITPICAAPLTGNHTLPTSVTSANKINPSAESMLIPAAPSTCLNVLGAQYPMPTLPDQIAAEYLWSDIHMFRSDLDYVLGLIHNGTYQLAYSEGPKTDPKLPGRNSNGLRTAVSTLAQLQQTQITTHTQLLNQQRTQIITDCNDALLLLSAINANEHPKKIDLARLEEEFKNIKKLRAAHQQHIRLILEESYTYDEHLKRIQEELHNAHLTGDRSLPLSPRKNLPEFTQRLLNSKK